MFSESYGSCLLCLSVKSVTRHLTSRAMNRSTNNTMYSALGVGRTYVGVSLKLLRSRVMA